jgi:response regulator RpfG family c-di-GMP phosphodiesterase
MKKIYILCIEDEPEVLEAVVRDLAPFESRFPIETAASVDEARRVVREVILPKGKLGLVVCDHIMPGEDGVSFLVSLHKDPVTATARKVLLTAQAGLNDTIEAVNKANLNHYLAKPWKKEELLATAKDQLTEFVLRNETDVMPYLTLLDAERLGEKLRQEPLPGDD